MMLQIPPTESGSAPETEHAVTCLGCGSASFEAMFDNFDRWHRISGSFRIVRCGGCGLVRLSPRPTRSTIHRYYPEEEYYSYGVDVAPELGAAVSRPFGSLLRGARDRVRALLLRELGYGLPLGTWGLAVARILRPLGLAAKHHRRGFPPNLGGGRLLDVGAGAGHFVDVMTKYGWDGVGIDTSAGAAEQARSTFGVNVMVASFEDGDLPPGPFDFVHMSHVIEHFFDPKLALRRAYERLAPGGIMFIETPNAGSSSARRIGPRWFPWETPRHLWLFTPQTLEDLLNEVGFTVTTMETYLFDRRYAFEDTFRREERMDRVIHPRPRLPLRRRPMVAALKIRDRIELHFDPLSGDIMTVWAVKSEDGFLNGVSSRGTANGVDAGM